MLFGSRLKKRFLGLAGLAVLGAVIHLLDSQRPEDIDLFSDVPDKPSEPDYYAVNSKYRSYDESGTLHRSIQAERLLHFPDSAQTHLETPLLITYNPQGQAQWHAQSKQAFIEGDGDHFQLNQNVIVWKADSGKQQNNIENARLKLLTDLINIDLLQNIAYTQSPITLDSDNGHIEAVGLKVNLNTHQVQLLDNVRGSYAQ